MGGIAGEEEIVTRRAEDFFDARDGDGSLRTRHHMRGGGPPAGSVILVGQIARDGVGAATVEAQSICSGASIHRVIPEGVA